MLNLFTVSATSKIRRTLAVWLRSTPMGRTSNSARCSLHIETVLAKTMHLSLLTVITCHIEVLFRVSWRPGMFRAL